MSTVIHKRNLTLVEIMFAIVLIAMIMNLATMYYFKGWDRTVKSDRKATRIMSVRNLKTYWRNFVHNNGKVFIVNPESVLFVNKSMVSVKKDKVIFSTGVGDATFAIPKDSAVVISRESGQGEPDRLILRLFSTGKKKRKLEDKSFRLVASVTGGAQ